MLQITTTNDSLPKDFHEASRMLIRPYIPISEQESKRLDILTKDCGDIVIYKGKRMTWGNADGGFALMPLAA